MVYFNAAVASSMVYRYNCKLYHFWYLDIGSNSCKLNNQARPSEISSGSGIPQQMAKIWISKKARSTWTAITKFQLHRKRKQRHRYPYSNDLL